MKTYYDLQQLLKQFGIFIYTGNRETDLLMMEEELRELQQWEMIDRKTFQLSLLLIRRELQDIRQIE